MAATSDTELVEGDGCLGQEIADSIVALAVDKLEGWAPLLEQVAVVEEVWVQEQADKLAEERLGRLGRLGRLAEERLGRLAEERLERKRAAGNRNSGTQAHRLMGRS